jgi:hypothetical protein
MIALVAAVARSAPIVVALGFLMAAACAQRAAAPRPVPSVPAVANTPPAEELPEVAAIRSLCGYLLVVNTGEAHFTVELSGTDVGTDTKGEHVLFNVDDLVVQAVTVSREQIGEPATGKSDRALLQAHEAWESEYLGRVLGSKLDPREVDLIFRLPAAPSVTGIMWWFEIPRSAGAKSGVSGSVFATVDVAHHVVGLVAQATGGLAPLDIMKRIAGWMGTLKVSATPISPAAVSASIRERSHADQTCANSG